MPLVAELWRAPPPQPGPGEHVIADWVIPTFFAVLFVATAVGFAIGAHRLAEMANRRSVAYQQRTRRRRGQARAADFYGIAAFAVLAAGFFVLNAVGVVVPTRRYVIFWPVVAPLLVGMSLVVRRRRPSLPVPTAATTPPFLGRRRSAAYLRALRSPPVSPRRPSWWTWLGPVGVLIFGLNTVLIIINLGENLGDDRWFTVVFDLCLVLVWGGLLVLSVRACQRLYGWHRRPTAAG